MKRRKVSDITREILVPFLDKNEFELIDVEFVKEGKDRFLRVTVDKEKGVGLNDCQMVSEYLSKRLDKMDPIEENYYLEVSSPGIERVLKKDHEFEKYKGETVEVKLYQALGGKKVLKGKLLGLVDNELRLALEEGDVSIPRDKIAKVKKVFEF